MEPLTQTKKQLRNENKRRKIAALLEMSELNDRDKESLGSSSCSEISKAEDSESEGPKSKKLKPDGATSSSNPDEETSYQDNTKPKFSEADLNELRSLLKMRRQELKKTPELSLKEPVGFQAEISVPASNRIPIFFTDIQHLILFAVLAQNSPSMPRWCSLTRCGHLSGVQLLIIEGAGISDYLQRKDSLPSLSESNFPIQLEVVMPAAYHGNLVEEFCSIPLSRIQCNNLVTAYGSLEAAVKSSCEVFKVLRAFFPVKRQSKETDSTKLSKKLHSEPENVESGSSHEPENVESGSSHEPEVVESLVAQQEEYLPASDKFPRTQLLLSAWQMIEEGYPIPLNASLREKYKNFVPTKESYKEVNNFSPMYGLDCEMCTTTVGSECTRVSIVNEKLETVLDTLVLPYNKITNYLTKFSGITATMMKDVTTRLEDVQKFIQRNLEPDSILVGQSLNFDLVSLKMMHPYCIDTSVIFNVTGDRYRKSKLKYLSEHFLKETIQTSNKGHCPVEDSSASLRLAQLKLSESIEFGDQVLSAQGICTSASKDNSRKKEKVKEDLSGYATSLFSYASRMGKHASILASPEILEKYMDYLNPKIASYEQINEDGSNKIISNGESSEIGHVNCIIIPSNKSLAEGVATKVQNNFLTMGHIQLSEQESNDLSIGDKKVLEKLNSWVLEMQRSVPLKTLSIVLLCGREKSANGVCFLKLHTRSHQKVNFNPSNL